MNLVEIERAQAEIRRLVLDAHVRSVPDAVTDEKVKAVIRRYAPSGLLYGVVVRSLWHFYREQKQIVRSLKRGVIIAYMMLASQKSAYVKRTLKGLPPRVRQEYSTDHTINMATPMGINPDEYFKRYVKPTIDRMADDEAPDPDSEYYWKRRSTLRNRAEREVRWMDHVDELDGLRKDGVKLVIISTHADCSPRCAPFQGKVFSLDGTSGVTGDGRRYEPIEKATDIYTPNGKWKNGLFGFNCRHKAYPFREGMRLPIPSKAVEKREYDITVRQRMMESRIRHWKQKAEIYKDLNRDYAKKASYRASVLTEEYKDFSARNGHAWSAERIRI